MHCNLGFIHNVSVATTRSYQTCRGVRATSAVAATAVAKHQQQPEASNMVRLAVIGDVHGQWTPADAACLRLLAPDAVLWVGESELPPSLLPPPPNHTPW
jgi:hypothetical protein